MRIGVLGAGRIGRAHAANLALVDGVDAVVVHDPDPEALASVPDEVVRAGSTDEVLDRCDGVVVATPTARHPDDVRAVADAGLPCLCEKPLSLDLAASEAVVAHAEAAGIELQVGFQRRFDPGFVEIRRLIETGALGRLYLLRAASHDFQPPHESYLPQAGSIFRDMHIHDSPPSAGGGGGGRGGVFAGGWVRGEEMFARHGDVDTSAAVVTLAGGAMAVLTGTRQNGVGYDHRTEAIGSLDSVSAGLGEHMPLRSSDPGGPQPVDPFPTFPVRFHDAYLAEVAAFAALVAGTGPNRCPGRAAVDALRLALAADRSLASGLPVKVADVTG